MGVTIFCVGRTGSLPPWQAVTAGAVAWYHTCAPCPAHLQLISAMTYSHESQFFHSLWPLPGKLRERSGEGLPRELPYAHFSYRRERLSRHGAG